MLIGWYSCVNPAADIADLHRDAPVQLSLNREIERVDNVGPEMRIQRLARAGSDAVDTWIERLWQGLRNLTIGDGWKGSS